jgi:hypothetical protein
MVGDGDQEQEGCRAWGVHAVQECSKVKDAGCERKTRQYLSTQSKLHAGASWKPAMCIANDGWC